MTAREKLIEALARALCISLADGDPDEEIDFFPDGLSSDEAYNEAGFLIVEKRPRWFGHVTDVEAVLAAIVEQGHAVVPRDFRKPTSAAVSASLGGTDSIATTSWAIVWIVSTDLANPRDKDSAS